MMSPAPSKRASPFLSRSRGFTLIEMLVVMVIIAVLASVVAPRYFESVDRAKEAALKSDLRTMRDAIDKYLSDTGSYPPSLQALVERHYIREVPADPITESAESWVTEPYPDRSKPGVYDIRSGADGVARDGSEYKNW